MREPRFFTVDGRLHLTWFEAGTHPRRFEPGRIFVSRLEAEGRWGEPRAVSPPDCVVWRVRSLGGRPVMSVYRGAGQLYTAHPQPLRVELWTSDDGFGWEPLDGDHPVFHVGGSETEFSETADGRTVYLTRKEGPDGGWGTDLGVAEGPPPHRPAWVPLPRKCDSPLLARLGPHLVLVTRRQLANEGSYRLDGAWARRLPPVPRTRLAQLAYWLTRKRTSVFLVDPDAPGLVPLADLPSRGDTAFAALVGRGGGDPVAEGRATVYNYSSDPDGPDLPWLAGQLRPTRVVACDVSLDRP